MEKTQRGFNINKFKDNYGSECSIQESSSAMDNLIWFGVNNANPQIMVYDAQRLGLDTSGAQNGWMDYPVPKEVSMSTRMHLDQKTLHKLMPSLESFVDTGDLEEEGYDYDFSTQYSIESFQSGGYEEIDMVHYKHDLDKTIKRNDETLERLEERISRLKKYREGLEIAKSNVEQVIKDESYG